MKHRCYNCKCLEEESTYQAHKRKKYNLKAKFYCKKCRKANLFHVHAFKDVCKIEVPVKEKISRRRFERINQKIAVKKKPVTLKEKIQMARQELSVEEQIAIGRFYRKCPPNCIIGYIVPLECGGPYRLSNLKYVSLSESTPIGIQTLEEAQKKEFENSDASTSTCEPINNNYFRLEKMVRRSKYKRLRRERQIKDV